MHRLHTGAAALAIAAAFSLSPALAETFTLQDALGLAYEGNPELEAARASQRAVDEGVAQARAGWRPTVTATGTYGWERSDTSGFGGAVETEPKTGAVTLDQPIFRGGRTFAATSQAQALVRAGRANLLATEQSILLEAVAAYMDVVRDQATVELRRNNVAVLKRQLQAADDRFRVGEITRTDVAQAQARLSGAQTALTTAEGELAASRSAFARVIGRVPEELETAPPFPQVPATEEDALEVALRNNPTLVAAVENERAASYAVDVAVGAMLPSLSVRGEYSHSEDVFGAGIENDTQSVTGVLTIPLYQAGFEHSSVREAKQRRNQAQLNVAAAERQVRESVRTAWEALRSAQAAIVSTEEQARANEIAYEGVQQETQVGARTTLDALNAEQELLDSRVAVVTSQRNTYVAAYSLLAAMGQLNAKSLGLPVKIYDPQQNYDDVSGRWFGLGD